MPVTFQQINLDREYLAGIPRDKSFTPPPGGLTAGHIKYNHLARIYDELKRHPGVDITQLTGFYGAIDNLITLTQLTLNVAIMEMAIGQECKRIAERALGLICEAQNLTKETYAFHTFLLYIDMEISTNPSQIRDAVAHNIGASTLFFVVKGVAKKLAPSNMQTSAAGGVATRAPILEDFARTNNFPAPKAFHALFDAYLSSPNDSLFAILEQAQHTNIKLYFNTLHEASSGYQSDAASSDNASENTNYLEGIAAILPPRIFTMPKTDRRVPADQLWYSIVQTGQQLSAKLSASWYTKHKQAGLLLKNFLQNPPDRSELVHEIIENKLVAFKSSTDTYRVTELMNWLQRWLPQTQQVIQADLDTLYVNPELKAENAAQIAPETAGSKAIHLWAEIVKSGRILSDKLAKSWYAKNKHAAVLIKQFIDYPPYTWQPDFLYQGLEQFAQSARTNQILEAATWAESWLKRFYKEGNTYGIYLTVKVDFATQLVLLNKALLQFIKTARGKMTAPQIGSIGRFQTQLQGYCPDIPTSPGAINKTGYFAILELLVRELHGEKLALLYMLEEHSNLSCAKESLAILNQWLAYFYQATPASAISIRNKKDAYQFSRLHFEFSQLVQWLHEQNRSTYSRDPARAFYAVELIKILNEFTTVTLDKASIDNMVGILADKISRSSITYDDVIMQKIKITISKLTFLDGNILERCVSWHLDSLRA